MEYKQEDTIQNGCIGEGITVQVKLFSITKLAADLRVQSFICDLNHFSTAVSHFDWFIVMP